MKLQRGFTLVELLITVFVVGVVGIALAPVFGNMLTAQRNAYAEKHRLNNQLIKAALLNYAANSAYGRLPSPYTGSGYTSTVYSTLNTTLSQYLTQTGINMTEVNDDGTAAQKVRVYQLVTPLTQQVPLYYNSGALATITYDYGVVYLTDCPMASITTCNPNPASSMPGSTPVAISGVNYTTWTTTGSDKPPVFVSSMPVQKQMLATTVQRLDKVRDTLLGFLRTSQQTAAGSDATNWFPNDLGTSASNGALAGKNPLVAAQQGCRDGWYDLSNASVLVLAAVGLAPQEFGKTAWGAPVEYCRDFDPLGTKSPNAPPHQAAIRINASVSAGISPDAAIPGNNIVLTF